ncbi:MAG: hypothetical protein FVQ77_01635 [Cytophagales bacterium]|nr:hypothetical protein [Cytophagales bacterium]
MNKQTFLNLIQNTNKAGSKLDKNLKALEVIVANTPYCQTAHLFLAKGYHDKNSKLADKKMRTAAVYAVDRTLLKKLIQQAQAPSSEKIEIAPSHPKTQEKRIVSETEIRDTQTKKPRLNKEIQRSKPSKIIKKTKKEKDARLPVSQKSLVGRQVTKPQKEKKPVLSVQEKNYLELKQQLANLKSPTREKIDLLQGMIKGKKFKRNDRKELNKILKKLEESTPSPPSPPLTPPEYSGGRTGQPLSPTRGKGDGKVPPRKDSGVAGKVPSSQTASGKAEGFGRTGTQSKKDLQAIIDQRLAEIQKEKKSSPIDPGKVTKSPKKKK